MNDFGLGKRFLQSFSFANFLLFVVVFVLQQHQGSILLQNKLLHGGNLNLVTGHKLLNNLVTRCRSRLVPLGTIDVVLLDVRLQDGVGFGLEAAEGANKLFELGLAGAVGGRAVDQAEVSDQCGLASGLKVADGASVRLRF